MTIDHDEEQVREQLKSLRVAPPDGGFSAALHRKLAAAGPPPEPGLWARLVVAVRLRPLLAGSTAGLAVAVGAFALMWVFLRPAAPTGGAAVAGPAVPQPPAPQALPAPVPQAPVYQVPAEKVAVIRLEFTADVAVEDVDFSVELPDGLAFWSEGERLAERSFEWHDRLDAGNNRIPVAVRAERPGVYRVKATASVGGQRLEHEVVLEVVEGV